MASNNSTNTMPGNTNPRRVKAYYEKKSDSQIATEEMSNPVPTQNVSITPKPTNSRRPNNASNMTRVYQPKVQTSDGSPKKDDDKPGEIGPPTHESAPQEAQLPQQSGLICDPKAAVGVVRGLLDEEAKYEDVDKMLEVKFGRKAGPTINTTNKLLRAHDELTGGPQMPKFLWGEEDPEKNEEKPLWEDTDLEIANKVLGDDDKLLLDSMKVATFDSSPLMFSPLLFSQSFSVAPGGIGPGGIAGGFHSPFSATLPLHRTKLSHTIKSDAGGDVKVQPKNFKKKIQPFYSQQQIAGGLGRQSGPEVVNQQVPSISSIMATQQAGNAPEVNIPFSEFFTAIVANKNCGFRPFAILSKNPAQDKWFYIDQEGLIQGNFSADEMDAWYNLDYFAQDLSIALNDKDAFSPLSVYLEHAAKISYDLYYQPKPQSPLLGGGTPLGGRGTVYNEGEPAQGFDTGFHGLVRDNGLNKPLSANLYFP